MIIRLSTVLQRYLHAMPTIRLFEIVGKPPLLCFFLAHMREVWEVIG
jgi:hypothetical protein